jgi:hypothetical protein
MMNDLTIIIPPPEDIQLWRDKIEKFGVSVEFYSSRIKPLMNEIGTYSHFRVIDIHVDRVDDLINNFISCKSSKKCSS